MSRGIDGVTIRPAVPHDAEQLAHLHVLTWEQAYTGLMPPEVFERRRENLTRIVEFWRRTITDGVGTTTVAADGPELIGWAGVGDARDDAPCADELWSLYVEASWYGRGVGYALITAALGDRPAYLWVLQGNDRAIAFYQRQGFAFDGATREDEYGVELRMTRGVTVNG